MFIYVLQADDRIVKLHHLPNRGDLEDQLLKIKYYTSASSFSFLWFSSVVVVVVVVVDVVAILNFGLVALRSAEIALANRIPGNCGRK